LRWELPVEVIARTIPATTVRVLPARALIRWIWFDSGSSWAAVLSEKRITLLAADSNMCTWRIRPASGAGSNLVAFTSVATNDRAPYKRF